MPEEASDGCSCKPDLKKEAQRTNRFNKNYSPNSASPCLTIYNNLKTTSGVANDNKSQEKDNIPCINIILKPILDSKTDEKDKDLQIVEITAITDNSNKHSTNNTNTSLPDNYQSTTKETENIEMKDVMVQTEVEKKMRHSSTQTTEATDQMYNSVSLIKQTIPEVTVENLTASQQGTNADLDKQNKGVQFKDDKTVADNVSNLNQSLSTDVETNTRSSSKNNPLCNRDATGIINIDSSTTMGIIDNQCVRTKGQETSVSPVECIDSMGTSYKLVNSEEKSNKPSDFKSCIKKSGQGRQGKLSDRIKHDIDKLEIGSCVSTQSSVHTMNTSHGFQQESVKTQTGILPCIDICKDIASQTETFKGYSDKSNSSLATRNNSTLPSVLSNNPPISRISIDTTDTMEWKSPAKNKSSKITIGTTVSSSDFTPSIDNTSCCSNQKLSIDGKSCKTRNATLDKDYSRNVSHEQQYPDNDRITVSGNIEEKSDMIKENVEKFDNGTATRECWANETRNISKLGINGDSFVRTKSTNTSNEAKTLESTSGLPLINNIELMNEETLTARNCCKSIAIQTNSANFSNTPEYSTITNTKLADKPDFMLSTPNTRNLLTASDLTRPQFIRMLTELKEHTCSLELQLAAMNEAMKREQSSRSKVFNSTLKNHQPMREHHLAYKSETKKITTTNESSNCTSDFSSIEYARQTPEEFDVANSIDTSCCAPSDDNVLPKYRDPGSETLIDETCCGSTIISESKSYTPQRSHKKLKTSSHTVPSPEPEQIIIVQDDSNISISKQIPKKFVFKTKRRYLWAPHLSDYRIRKQKEGKPTPSRKSMNEPEVPSQSVTPNSLIGKSKVDVSCSPTNCCNAHADSLETMFKAGRLSPISKLEESDVTVRSATYSTTSNPSVNRMTVRPAFMSSTLRRSPSTKNRKVTESAKVSSCGSDTSNYSNAAKRCSESGKKEQNSGKVKENEEYVVQTSPFKSKIPKVRPRLGIKQSSSKFRTKVRAKSSHSNSYLYSSMSRGSFQESSSKISSKNRKTQHDATKPPLLHSKKLGVVPWLKLKSIRSPNPSNNYIEKNSGQADLDPACCSETNENGGITSEVNNSLHSNRIQFVLSEKVHTKAVDQNQGKDHFAYTIKTDQNTPFLVNNFVKCDSEEEVSSTDYGFNESVTEYCGKESKDNANGKKRKRNSGFENFIKREEQSGLSTSNTSELRNWQNNSQSFQYQEYSGHNSRSKNNSQSIGSNHQHSSEIQEFNNVSGKSNHTNSQEKDSKCTIRVTVSLDNTPSNEEVKNI